MQGRWVEALIGPRSHTVACSIPQEHCQSQVTCVITKMSWRLNWPFGKEEGKTRKNNVRKEKKAFVFQDWIWPEKSSVMNRNKELGSPQPSLRMSTVFSSAVTCSWHCATGMLCRSRVSKKEHRTLRKCNSTTIPPSSTSKSKDDSYLHWEWWQL